MIWTKKNGVWLSGGWAVTRLGNKKYALHQDMGPGNWREFGRAASLEAAKAGQVTRPGAKEVVAAW